MLSIINKNSLRSLVGSTVKQIRCGSTRNSQLILGIETSCDDTGCAVLDLDGNILGESLNSQHLTHLNNGGIIPPIAQDLHRKHIENVVEEAITRANIKFSDLEAISVTVKPGLPLSLMIGTKYAKYLCKTYNKPLIPIHHMEAHALTARLENRTVEFPFLVLLISGGHCLLAIAQKIDKFLLLGESLDDAPGEAFDKVARRMKLRNLPEYSKLSGGEAIELAAAKADNPLEFQFTIPLQQNRDCMFSMAGLKSQVQRHLLVEEAKYGVPADGVIPNVNNLCAGFQLVLTRHLCHRVQRGMIYANRKGLIPPDKQVLVVSGGVACNNFIAKGIEIVCQDMDYKMVRPSKKLCTDNGIMIAWNGVEKFKENLDIFNEFDSIDVEKSSPIGTSLIEDVRNSNISCKWTRLKQLNSPQKEWI